MSRKSHVFFEGDRAEQTVLARLRLGHCALAASASRWSDLLCRMCQCGSDEETVAHFLLRCPLYTEERKRLISTVSKVFNGELTEEALLGAGGTKIPKEHLRTIAKAVYQFVLDTQREI